MRAGIILFILFFGSCYSMNQQQERGFKFTNYAEMREHFGTLYQHKKYEEAADLLEKALDRFPDHVMANAYNLALTYGHLNQYEKGIRALQYALDRNVWFNIWAFDHEMWSPYKERDNFKRILSRNEALRQEAQKKAKPDLFVEAPEGYTNEKKYPLFIALHGGGGNIWNFKEVWKSERMKKEFVTAYVQSSQLVAMNGFSWTEDIEIAKREIVDAYHKVIGEYSIDKNEIIIGGFSSGGVAALEIVLCHSIPVAGFIVLCPAKPVSFVDKNIQDARRRGVRGTILTTEMDPRLSVQKEMVEIFKKKEFPYQFIVTPDIGHWFPEDLDRKIDDAIEHVRAQSTSGSH